MLWLDECVFDDEKLKSFSSDGIFCYKDGMIHRSISKEVPCWKCMEIDLTVGRVDEMHYQDINEMLAKGIKTENMPSDYAEAVNLANQYLVEGKGKKPAWMDEFLESNRL